MQRYGTSSRVGEDLRGLVCRLERYLRLEATDKLTVMATCVILAAVTFALVTSAIFFLSTGIVKSLTLLTGNEMVGCYLVGGVLLLVILLLFLFRKPLIEAHMVKLFSRQLLDGPTLMERFMKGKESSAQWHDLARSISEELADYDEEGGRQ